MSDTGNYLDGYAKETCGNCGIKRSNEGHDGCIGSLDNVMNACCGHGENNTAYVQFWNKECIRGNRALEYIRLNKWYLANEKQPERIKEPWFPEETEQEVIIQYVRSGRYEMGVGWFEGGKWWCNDEEVKYHVVAWKHRPPFFTPNIHWEFKEWVEKDTQEAWIIGVDDFGVEYEATGIMGFDEIVEVREIKSKEN